MPRFMDVHDGFGGVTREQLEEAAAADKSIEAEEGVHFERAWLDPEAGKVFCLSTGPSKEAVLRIKARRMLRAGASLERRSSRRHRGAAEARHRP